MAIAMEMTNEIEFACNERSKSNEICAVSIIWHAYKSSFTIICNVLQRNLKFQIWNKSALQVSNGMITVIEAPN